MAHQIIRMIVDDEREFDFPSGINHTVRNSKVAIAAVMGFDHIDELWLDHDLGIVDGTMDTIRPFVQFLEELIHFGKLPCEIGKVVIHTSSPVGRRYIESAFVGKIPIEHVSASDYVRLK